MPILQMLFSAKGRIRRRDFWLWSILWGILAFGTEFVAYKVWGTTGRFALELQSAWHHPGTAFGLVYFLNLTIGRWPTVCLNAKRWHDRNRSGWMAAIF